MAKRKSPETPVAAGASPQSPGIDAGNAPVETLGNDSPMPGDAVEGGDLFADFDAGDVAAADVAGDGLSLAEIPPAAVAAREPSAPATEESPPAAEPQPPADLPPAIPPGPPVPNAPGRPKRFSVELPLSPVGRRTIEAESADAAWEAYRSLAGIIRSDHLPIIREIADESAG